MIIYILHKVFALKEVPVKYTDRIAGSYSRLNTFKDGFRVIKLIVKLRISTIIVLLSMVLFIHVFIVYLKIGLVLKFSTLIVFGVLLTLPL